MDLIKLNDCILAFMRQVQEGERPTRHQIRDVLGREFMVQSADDQILLNRLIGLCDRHLTAAGLVHKTDNPNDTIDDTFHITPQGVHAWHEHLQQTMPITIGYLREMGGSRVLRASWSDFSESWAEWAFHDPLEKLPPDYTVFHSIRWESKGSNSRGEIDFLVAHPQKGVLIIEVKGGIITVTDTGKGNQWRSQSASGRVHRLHQDPVSQAFRNSKELKSWLDYHPTTRHFKYPVFHAIAFPNSEIDPDMILRMDAPREILIDINDIDNLPHKIEAIFDYHQAHAHTGNQMAMAGDEAVAVLRALILPTKSLEPRLSTLFERERRKIETFTNYQKRVLDYLRFHQRTMVLGGAGTGKTILALEKTMLLAQEGYKVLFLAFTAGLADFAATALTHPNITVTNLHRLVGTLMYKVGLGERMNEKNKTQFNEGVKNSLLEVTQALRANPNWVEKYCYDALVVDEGQDFDDAEWAHLVKLLKHPVEDVLYVFADDSQRIFNDLKESLPPLGTPFFLHENCRTTQHIHATAQAYATMPSKCDGPVGRPVQVHHASTSDDIYALVRDLLHWLIIEEQVPAHAIAILTPLSHNNKKDISVWSKDDTPLGDFIVTRRPNDSHNPLRTVRVSTIHAYKGLECGVTILTELDKARQDTRNAVIYVALTRARNDVHVVGVLPPPIK